MAKRGEQGKRVAGYHDAPRTQHPVPLNETEAVTVKMSRTPAADDRGKVTVTRTQVLEGTRYKRPDRGGVKPGTHYVVIRGRKVPAKWALRQALDLPGVDFHSSQAVYTLQRLGFTCGQEPGIYRQR